VSNANPCREPSPLARITHTLVDLIRARILTIEWL
jgi:hypothetical protein